MDTVQNTLENLNATLLQTLNNDYVSAVLLIFFIIYAGTAAPALPKSIAKLFDYPVFKIFVMALILFINNFNPQVALIVAVGFFISLQTLSRHNLLDMAKEMFNLKKVFGKKEEAPAPEGEMEATPVVETQQDYGLNMEAQVSGMAARTPYYQGPQGMKHPVGFSGVQDGEEY